MAVFVQHKSRMNSSLKSRTKDSHYIFLKYSLLEQPELIYLNSVPSKCLLCVDLSQTYRVSFNDHCQQSYENEQTNTARFTDFQQYHAIKLWR